MGGDLALYHGLNGTLHHGSSLILGNICIKIMYTYIHIIFTNCTFFSSGSIK